MHKVNVTKWDEEKQDFVEVFNCEVKSYGDAVYISNALCLYDDDKKYSVRIGEKRC